MGPTQQRRKQFLIGSVAVLAGALAIAGCQDKAAHPDEKSAVTSSLNSNNLKDVSVSQDQEKGVMTLTGNVDTDDQKSQAAVLAKQAAPDYTIADEIGVGPPGAESQAKSVHSNLDNAIEDNYKASIKAHKNLDDQSIDYSAKNGTLMLKGSVKTVAQKREAEKLAKEVPNVQQVVNEIEVNLTSATYAQCLEVCITLTGRGLRIAPLLFRSEGVLTFAHDAKDTPLNGYLRRGHEDRIHFRVRWLQPDYRTFNVIALQSGFGAAHQRNDDVSFVGSDTFSTNT